MKKAASETLYETIITKGVEYVSEAVADKLVENYYLDFKTTEVNDYSGKNKLQNSDKKNYAKSISAFGNSDGGVILWGVATGESDADFATEKKPIKNVSNFISLLEGYTSLMTSPQHQNVENKIIFEDQEQDEGYVVTHIPKARRRPLQVLNDDFRYYIRAGSSSLPAPDTFLRSLFGEEAQPDVFITWGTAPVKLIDGDTIKIEAGVILHNAGESVGKNINGYVHVGGLGMGIEVNQNTNNAECFSYSTNNIAGMKVGFMARGNYRLGIEQEVLPLTIHIEIKKPITEHGIQVRALVNCENQMTYRIFKEIPKDNLEQIYDAYIADNNYDVVGAIFGNEEFDKD